MLPVIRCNFVIAKPTVIASRKPGKTGLVDAVQTGFGQLDNSGCLGVMDFRLWAVAWVPWSEKLPAWWSATQKAVSVIIVCASGGARMQKNAEPDADGEDISGFGAPSSRPTALYPVLTNPTTGGVAALPCWATLSWQNQRQRWFCWSVVSKPCEKNYPMSFRPLKICCITALWMRSPHSARKPGTADQLAPTSQILLIWCGGAGVPAVPIKRSPYTGFGNKLLSDMILILERLNLYLSLNNR